MEKQNEPTRKLISWLDENILAILAGFLIIFIPLYPKIPLADLLPGYIVRLRLEDFFILFTFLLWIIQLIRKKANWHPLMTKIILIYLGIGLLSTLSAIFVTKTVPMSDIHIFKIFLHWFRRVEYFSLFFIFYSAVKTKTQAKVIILSLIPITLLVSLYGFGQKYFYWPVYSTMNREFSKGVRLYLTEHARVPSTFGGHYDAAAWIMAVITIILAIGLLVKNKWIKIFSFLAYIAGFWLLILTASRTSFIAYLFSVSILMFFLVFIKSFKWVIPRWLIVMIFSMLIMLSFGDLSERYAQVLGLDRFKETDYVAIIRKRFTIPEGASEIDMVTTPSDETPVTKKPLPADVYEDIPDIIIVASSSGELEEKQVERVYSANAHKYGLSAAIRLDALWPRAWAGFRSNPLLGSGYSTLTKESVGTFTEAESTDNDFLRSLGETGILGFIFFYGAVVTVAVIALKNAKSLKDPIFTGYAVGFSSATVGLLLNAIYIDIFEASKVIEVFWALAGIALILPFLTNKPEVAPINSSEPDTKPDKPKSSKKKKKKSSKKA